MYAELAIDPALTDWHTLAFFDGATPLTVVTNTGGMTVAADLVLDPGRANNSLHAVLTRSNGVQRTSSINMLQSDTLRTPDLPRNLEADPAEDDIPSGSATQSLSWIAPTNAGSVTGYSYALDDGVDEVSEGAATSVTYTNLPNGTYTFRVRAQANGVWGSAAAFTLIIDATPTIEPSAATLDLIAVTSASFTVAMSGPSDVGTTVTVTRTSGDAAFTVTAGSSLIFTPADWTLPQTVTVARAEPYTPVDGFAVFTLSAPDSAPVNITAFGIDTNPPSSLLYEESFDYGDPGGTYNMNTGYGGGIGWDGLWAKSASGSGGDYQKDLNLAYTSGVVGLITGGGSMRPVNNGIYYYRPLGTYFSDAGGDRTLWVSLLAYGTGSTAFRIFEFINSSNGVTATAAAQRLSVGHNNNGIQQWQVGADRYGAGVAAGGSLSTNPAAPDLLLLKIELRDAADDRATLWVNPALDAEPVSGGVTYTRNSPWIFDTLRITVGNASNLGLDEIRIGEGWAEVLPRTGGGDPDDTDTDGLPDAWEELHFGSPTNAYPDTPAANDINTLREAYIAGFDPTAPDAGFTVDTATGTGFPHFAWAGISGRVYHVDRALDTPDAFLPLATNLAWDAPTFTDPAPATNPVGYYRIRVERSP